MTISVLLGDGSFRSKQNDISELGCSIRTQPNLAREGTDVFVRYWADKFVHTIPVTKPGCHLHCLTLL